VAIDPDLSTANGAQNWTKVPLLRQTTRKLINSDSSTHLKDLSEFGLIYSARAFHFRLAKVSLAAAARIFGHSFFTSANFLDLNFYNLISLCWAALATNE